MQIFDHILPSNNSSTENPLKKLKYFPGQITNLSKHPGPDCRPQNEAIEPPENILGGKKS